MSAHQVICPYCNAPAQYEKESRRVYGGLDYGPIWLCSNYPECDAYVGVHKNTVHRSFVQPLGRLANAELRLCKKNAHALFDNLWKHEKNRKKARTKAYQWLAKELGIDAKDCHIGMFDVDMCKRVVELCKKNQIAKEVA